MTTRAHTVVALGIAVLLSACASTPGRPYDPFEASNRVMYAINDPLDRYFAKPIAQAWVDYMPDVVQMAVRNYVNNIDDLFSGVNGLLQGKLDKAGNDFGRVLINSGFGLAGLIDIASDAGIPRGNEDFGQTFGYWGIPQGPYLFIPLWGPTTVRDGTGSIMRLVWSPTTEIPDVAVRNVIYGLGAIDLRAGALEATSLIEQASLDPYTFVRRSYLQRREYQVYDGKPPPEKDED
ncbi:MAG: VacJ family lipoprotein [Burkholderiales bacterium]|nr:VacJ family lipoprotein [Burkholderiales bacterium]